MDQMQFQQQSGFLQTSDERQLGMFIHLSSLANIILFPAGYVIPIVLWQTNKDKMPALDAHGKEAANWMITSGILHLINLVVFVIGIILTFFVVGIFVIMINILVFLGLAIAGTVFSVIAAVKANNGEHWAYPINMRFIK